MAKKPDHIVIQPDTKIGNISAETDDEFLFSCFVDHPALASATEVSNPQMFLSGRTGAGKTAIIRMIGKNNKNTNEVNLQELSLDYIANSDIIRFLSSLDIDLDLFFQALWKHVLCIEYVRMKFEIKNSIESKSIFDKIRNFFSNDERKKRALNYLQKWESQFWITMDENIKEITTKLETDVDLSMGAEVQKFRTNAGYSRTLSSEKRADVTSRAKKIVNADQLSELSRVLDLISAYEVGNKFKNFYILVDRLDEKWVDESIRFKLIRALIESLKSFGKIHDLKIVVAIRSDVIERVVQENKEIGFQREKYDDYFLRIIWRKDQLKQLVEKRINFLYRHKYTSNSIFFNDLFPNKVGQRDPFDFMIERTLYRPRDIISFINICLAQSQGRTSVSTKDIRIAEGEYSRIRLQALQQEWQSALPSLEIALVKYSKFGVRFPLSTIATKSFIDDLILEIAQAQFPSHDPIAVECMKYFEEPKIESIWNIAKITTCELYRIGAIGVKIMAQERFIYSHQDTPVIGSEMIDENTRVHIHPMLHRALNLTDDRIH